MADARRHAPLHLPITLGIGTGLYAISLAGITALQSHADATIAAERQPLRVSVDELAGQREALEGQLNRTLSRLRSASAAYDSTLGPSAELERTLAALAAGVQDATGAAARLPTSVRLPSAPRVITVVQTAPTTHATTTASGQPK